MLVSGPAHGSLTLNADGSFTYTPAANYNGPDSFTYKANDGQADSNVATVSHQRRRRQRRPGRPMRDSIAATEDTPVAGNVLTNDTDVDGDAAQRDPGQRPGPWQPDARTPTAASPTRRAPNYNGPDSFTYKANDGQADSNRSPPSRSPSAPVNDPPGTSGGIVADDACDHAEDTTSPSSPAACWPMTPTSMAMPITAILVDSPAHGSTDA